MHSATLPWKVLSSHAGVGVLTEGWTLDTVSAETDDVRTFITEIVFATPFASIPVVQLGLTGFDLDQRDSARITLKAENITTTGFQAVISTWAATRVFAVEFNWLAIGA
jgi:hypothetical protein